MEQLSTRFLLYLGILGQAFGGPFWTVEKAQHRYTIIYERCNCLANPTYFKTTDCQIADRSGITLNINFRTKLDIEVIHSDLQIYLVRRHQIDRFQKLVEMKFDCCEFFKGNDQSPLKALIYQEYAKQNNFPKACPIKKDVPYALKNFTIDTSAVPIFVPDMNFFVTNSFTTTGKQWLHTTNVSGRIMDINSRKGASKKLNKK